MLSTVLLSNQIHETHVKPEYIHKKYISKHSRIGKFNRKKLFYISIYVHLFAYVRVRRVAHKCICNQI